MTTTRPDLDSAAAVLGYARASRAAMDRADADLLHAAVTWAEQHPPELVGLEATWPGTQGELSLAGEGAPEVAEFCIAEFAAAIGRSTDSGRVLIAHAIELKYRLPKTQHRVEAGGVAPWKARRIAEATLSLSAEAATFVDAQVAGFAGKVGPAQLDRLVAEAITRFMPERARQDAENAADGRHLKFHHQQVSFNGTTFVAGELDLADALDLDAAITRGAEQLLLAGCEEPLDVRRAMAAGELGRRQLALDLAHTDQTDTGQTGADQTDTTDAQATRQTRRQKPRQVVLYVHLSEAALAGAGSLELARVENHRQGVTADQVRTWCANPDTQVTVKPVIDLAEHIRVDAYEVPDRLAEQTQLRDGACVFPWCTRPASTCDCDHVIPYAQGGTTCSCNIAPLCRRHHRLKTHSSWSYTVLEPGTFLWSSPHGYQFLRDHQGTHDVTGDRPPDRPTDPPHF